jgi:hypothetical protein
VHEQRYEATAVGVKAARLAAKVRAEMAREKAATKLQEAYKKRWAKQAGWLAALGGNAREHTVEPETLRSWHCSSVKYWLLFLLHFGAMPGHRPSIHSITVS